MGKKQFSEVAELAQTLLNKDDKNKAALLFLVKAQTEMCMH